MGGRAETIEFATPPAPNRISRTSGVAMSNRVSSRRNSQVSNRPYPTVIDERCKCFNIECISEVFI